MNTFPWSDLGRPLSASNYFTPLRATPSQVFWKVRWPAAQPYVFSALKIASASAIIGALIAEWVRLALIKASGLSRW